MDQRNCGEGGSRIKQGVVIRPIPLEHHVAVLYVAVNGHLDDIAVEEVGEFERGLHAHLARGGGPVLARIRAEKDLTPEIESELKGAEEYKRVESRK